MDEALIGPMFRCSGLELCLELCSRVVLGLLF